MSAEYSIVDEVERLVGGKGHVEDTEQADEPWVHWVAASTRLQGRGGGGQGEGRREGEWLTHHTYVSIPLMLPL